MAYVNLCQVIYPVGTIYMSTKNISPSDMFGGTWEEIKDERFWLTTPLSKTTNQTGGEATHKLTIAEMPNHDHALRSTSRSSGGAGNFGVVDPWNTGTSPASDHGTWFRGNDQPHNNMPPYRTCYSWIRTA